MEVVIFTDGGCHPNPGNGAWAFVCASPYEESCGYEANTTNNQMEMKAVINAIKFGVSLNGITKIKIFSDSQYVVKGFNEWMHGWAARGWTKKEGSIMNLDLWKRLYVLKDKVTLIWVRGHNGNRLNEKCDQLVKATYTDAFKTKMKY